jgi:FkbM family methyltransferase
MNNLLIKLFNDNNDFIYVDCGARGDAVNSLVDAIPNAQYFGFEPDKFECDRLNCQAKNSYRYFPVALAGREGVRKIYLTNNPACSSLLKPNDTFWGRFKNCSSQIVIKKELKVETYSLNNFLPKISLKHIDFLELDTQGSELEILYGADKYLSSSIIVLRIEVEFSPMYKRQPLFSDIDNYLQKCGFMLFDLSRYYYRRENYPTDLDTKGQLLYGQAIYLKDYFFLPKKKRVQSLIKLALVADYYGFYDYVVELFDLLLEDKEVNLLSYQKKMYKRFRDNYITSLKNKNIILKIIKNIEKSFIGKFSDKFYSFCVRFLEVYIFPKKRRNFSWCN